MRFCEAFCANRSRMSGNLKERLNDSLIVAAQLWIDTRSQYGEVFEISYELDEVKGIRTRVVFVKCL